MKRTGLLFLVLAAVVLAACSANAPQAPAGFSRRPANSAETVSALARPTDDPPNPPQPVVRAVAAPAAVNQTFGQPAATEEVVMISDFSAPGGIASLSAAERTRLIAVAASARQVSLYCRGDRVRPSRGERAVLLRRGLIVKRFLIAGGVDNNHIRLFARSAGAFVADNATAVGRAKNRRVEIHLA